MLLKNAIRQFYPRVAATPASVRPLSSRVTVKDAVSPNAPTGQVSVLGWVKSVRKQKELVFIDINDGSTGNNLQVVMPVNQLKGVSLNVGCSVVAHGLIMERSFTTQGVEMTASNVQLLGACNARDYPFKKGKIHGLEYTRKFPHLRPKTGTFSNILRLRNATTMAIHRFFQDRGFINIHTPVITSSDCEGAGGLFKITPAESTEEKGREFFPTATYLTVSGQLHAEAIASGMGSVYTFGPTFRAEKSHTKRHLAEFYMIEAETLLHKENKLMELLNLVEDLYKYTLDTLLRDNSEDMNHNQECSNETKSAILYSLERPFTRMTYTEAINILNSASKENFNLPPKWGIDLQREHELYLLSVSGQHPIFIIDFPATIKPFYARAHTTNSELVSCVDLLVPGVGEVVGGSVREEREEVLTDRLTRLGLLERYQWYLDLRRFGTVPHGGFGIGFDRLLQAYLGIRDIRDVVPFPRYLGSCPM